MTTKEIVPKEQRKTFEMEITISKALDGIPVLAMVHDQYEHDYVEKIFKASLVRNYAIKYFKRDKPCEFFDIVTKVGIGEYAGHHVHLDTKVAWSICQLRMLYNTNKEIFQHFVKCEQ